MLKETRQAYIIQQINIHKKVLSSDLCVQLNVSEDTVRRDLNELANNGQVLKVHGGALAKSFPFPSQDGSVYSKESKKVVVQKAMELLQPGMTVLVGGGSILIEWARSVPTNLPCTFFTVSPLVALELAEKKNSEVILIGGKLSPKSQIVSGAQVTQDLSDLRVDLCLLGADGVSLDEGITDTDWEAVQIKRAMIKCAQKIAILSMAEALNVDLQIRVAPLRDLTYLLTDLEPEHPKLSAFTQQIVLL